MYHAHVHTCAVISCTVKQTVIRDVTLQHVQAQRQMQSDSLYTVILS